MSYIYALAAVEREMGDDKNYPYEPAHESYEDENDGTVEQIDDPSWTNNPLE
jgi:hypothetical protein